MIKFCLLFQAQQTNGLKDAKCTKRIGVGGVFWLFEADGDMALSGKVVNLIGLHIRQNAHEARGVGQITVVQHEVPMINVRIFVKMIDALRVEQGCTALDAVDLIALRNQEFGKVAAVLTRNTCDEGPAHEENPRGRRLVRGARNLPRRFLALSPLLRGLKDDVGLGVTLDHGLINHDLLHALQ